MDKVKVTMTRWELYIYNERYKLTGVADDHPRLGRNQYIGHTSYLVDYKLEEDILTYETRNTIYLCPLKYMKENPYMNVDPDYKRELLNGVTKQSNILDRIIAVSARISLKDELENECQVENELFDHILSLQEIGKSEVEEISNKANQYLIEQAKKYEDCIYIDVFNVGSGDLLSYHIGECVGVITPIVHSGMSVDSVLYLQYADQEENNAIGLDFRYFPKGNLDVMETYGWSDNILKAVIKNSTRGALLFNGIEMEIGETKEFTPQNHKQGLISPDFYNGKSILNMEIPSVDKP